MREQESNETPHADQSTTALNPDYPVWLDLLMCEEHLGSERASGGVAEGSVVEIDQCGERHKRKRGIGAYGSA
jgi:hypothetical protein